VCPSIRCSASTFTPADTASLAHVCRKACGVMAWTPNTHDRNLRSAGAKVAV
jgi:hypothetical protein